MPRLQVLVSTMNSSSFVGLYKSMNLKTDALIINQCDSVGYQEDCVNDSHIQCYSFNERGLSRSRNNALLRCTGDIVCLADDDMRYSDTYAEDIVKEFESHPEADAIVFNVAAVGGTRSPRVIDSFGRVGKAESRMYGSVHIAIRRKALLRHNVYFNTQFGAGAKYSCGEDTLFLKELISKGLRLYKSPIEIANVDMSESTWFEGHNEKYYHDKGALIAAAYPLISYPLAFLQSVRNSRKNHGTLSAFSNVFGWYCSGIRSYVEDLKR